ncbi:MULTISPECIES: DUF1828 domain-containing protein [unclassified Pseudomonas]|uniref:DUF1828 domain-containing protein n=1 Tax=unclassified Pseudomonas TaxID=196821 RepID=UPI0015A6EF22|nr:MULTISPECIES: DUF1828 domain-containing protein [unclassified Pseudomonas]
MTVPYDGNLIGAYVEDIGRGRVRISDNADTLFHAMTVGIQPTASRGRKLADIAADNHVHLSDDGELFVACDKENASFYLTQIIDAAASISYACSQWQVASESRFDRVVSDALKKSFPGKVKRNFTITGASGHQLKFPFAIDVETPEIQVVQTVSAVNGVPYWPSVYQALGKMIDVKNAIPSIRRTVIFEEAAANEISKASAALVECASVLIYSTPAQLTKGLRAA